MADPKDPLGILNTDAKQLNLIREIYEQIAKEAGDVAKAAKSFTEEQKKAAQALGLINERNATLVAAEKELDQMYKGRAQHYADTKDDINELLSINKKLRDQELQNEREKLTAIENNYKVARQRHDLLFEELGMKKKLLDKAREEYKAELARIESQKNAKRLEGAAYTRAQKTAVANYVAQKRSLAGLEDELDTQNQILVNTKERLDVQADQVERGEQTNKGYETGLGFLDGMIEKTGFFSEKWKTGPLGGLTDFLEGQGDMSELLDELKIKAQKINFKNLSANVLIAIIEQTTKFMLEFDKLGSSFRKNTGIIDRGFSGMEQSIVNVQRANLRMGVSMDEAFASANALVSTMADFTLMSDKAQNKVLQVTAVMQEFGVSAQTTSEIFNTFSKGLGYDADQLEKLGTQIMGIATSLKVPPQIIATEFNAASKELMKYGGEMIGVFEGLAEQSKQTGLAIGELMGVVKEYDTFAGAGEAVGKLNAILGGPYLNSINMLYATEEDRVKMLRESISLSGRQFKDLSRFEQQAIASAAGISDMSQAAKLFGGTASEFANSRMEMKEMQERAAKAQATMDKFAQVMQSFAIALGPLVTILGFVAEALIFLLNPLGEIARFFDQDSDIISGLGTFTILLYGTTAAILKLTTSAITFGTAITTAFLPVVAGVLTFTALKAILEEIPGPIRAIVGGIIALVTALYAFGQAQALATALPTLGASMKAYAAFTATAAASIAGFGGMLSGLDDFDDGKKKGEPVPGGMGQLSKDGKRELFGRDGNWVMVDGPTVTDIKSSDTILNNSQTEKVMAGGGSAELLPMLTALQATLGELTTAIATAKQTENIQKDNQEIVIKMDARKVAEGIHPYALKWPGIRLV
jgi:hypothetical protein